MRLNLVNADISIVHDLAYVHVMSWKSAYCGIIPDEYLSGLSVDAFEDRFKKSLSINHKSDIFKILYADSIAVGIMIYGKCRDSDTDKYSGEIMALYLLENYWHRGLGSIMISHILNEFKRQGYVRVYLWVLSENERARSFYEKCGFENENVSKEVFIGRPLTEMRYSINLL